MKPNFSFARVRAAFCSAIVAVATLACPAHAQTTSFFTGAGAGGGPHIIGRRFDNWAPYASYYAFSSAFRGGTRIAAYCDVNRDGVHDIIVGAGPGGGPHLRIFDGKSMTYYGQQVELASRFVYDQNFTGGIFVACGDFNNDGFADIVTGAGEGGGPHVRTIDGLQLIGAGVIVPVGMNDFFAYHHTFTGGVSVAVGDVNGDGLLDIITGAGPGGAPHVRAFSFGSGAELMSFYAFDVNFRGGVDVAAGRVTARTGPVDVIVGAGPGGGPHVQTFKYGYPGALLSFFAYEPHFGGGVHVAAGDWNRDGIDDIGTGAGPDGGPRVRIFNGANVYGPNLRDNFAYDVNFAGGAYVSFNDWGIRTCADGLANSDDSLADANDPDCYTNGRYDPYKEEVTNNNPPTATPVPPTPTPVPTATKTAVPTATKTAVPTATKTAVPTATKTYAPTATSTPVPTSTPTKKPGYPHPTMTATPKPTNTVPSVPTATPTPISSFTPAPGCVDEVRVNITAELDAVAIQLSQFSVNASVSLMRVAKKKHGGAAEVQRDVTRTKRYSAEYLAEAQRLTLSIPIVLRTCPNLPPVCREVSNAETIASLKKVYFKATDLAVRTYNRTGFYVKNTRLHKKQIAEARNVLKQGYEVLSRLPETSIACR